MGKENQRQCGKCRGKEIDGMERRKWMGSIEWEQTRGRRKGRGETVIDYGIVNEEAYKKVEEFRIGERVESDHLTLQISIEETNHEKRGKE
jgi:hypothetical protein